jgi:hypothetical protein
MTRQHSSDDGIAELREALDDTLLVRGAAQRIPDYVSEHDLKVCDTGIRLPVYRR